MEPILRPLVTTPNRLARFFLEFSSHSRKIHTLHRYLTTTSVNEAVVGLAPGNETVFNTTLLKAINIIFNRNSYLQDKPASLAMFCSKGRCKDLALRNNLLEITVNCNDSRPQEIRQSKKKLFLMKKQF
jgi:hypothetical protein